VLVDRYGARLPLVLGPMIALFTIPGVGGSYWANFFPALVVLAQRSLEEQRNKLAAADVSVRRLSEQAE
jgi:hypothetical protein